MKYRLLDVSHDGYCRVVRLREGLPARGPVVGLADEIDDLCDGFDSDDATRVVVLDFVREGPPDAGGARPDAGDGARIVDRLARLQAPVIGVLAGDVFGFALEVALACDLRLSAVGSRFALPQVLEGGMPAAGGTQRLPRLIGRGRALEMILTGAPVDCDDALQMGLVHRVTPIAEVSSSALQLAATMAAASPVAMRYAKEALHSGLDLTLEQGMRMELDLYLLLFSTSDRTEGITAFREKRKPRFRGA